MSHNTYCLVAYLQPIFSRFIPMGCNGRVGFSQKGVSTIQINNYEINKWFISSDLNEHIYNFA